MRIKGKDIIPSQIKPANNYVLVKASPSNDTLKLKSGASIYLDTSFEPRKHSITSGIVEAVPDKIIFDNEYWDQGIRYDTDIEVQPGDKVIFQYLVWGEAVKEKKYIQHGSDFYLLVKYDMLFAAVRDEKIISLNGWLIVEPLPEEQSKTTFFIPENIESKKSMTKGVIRHAGLPNRAYLDFPYDYDDPSHTIGDIILFSKDKARPLEYEM